MNKLENLLNKRYKEEQSLNILVGKVVGTKLPLPKSGFTYLKLVKVESSTDIIFSFNDKPLRFQSETPHALKIDYTIEGNQVYNYLFWINSEENKTSDTDEKYTINYLKTGQIEYYQDLEIAFGDEIVQYLIFKRNKDLTQKEISESMYEWLTFTAQGCTVLFIETFPNSNSTFRIHGYTNYADVKITDNKWIVQKIIRKPFPSNYDDFKTYKVLIYDKLKFLQVSEAREATETLNLRESKKSGTILSLWQKYSDIELKRATDLQDRLGNIHYRVQALKKNGITQIKLDLTPDQKEIFSNELTAILNGSFQEDEFGPKLVLNSYDKNKSVATIIDEDYPLQLDTVGELTFDIKGNAIVHKRRENALRTFRSNDNLVLVNVRLAIEGQASKMSKPRNKFKPFTEKTKKFYQEQFHIDDLTEDQKAAVDIAVNTNDIAIIQGPPGTGKSTVVSVICHRLMELAEKEDNIDKAILVSAFQNDTVEHIASKIYSGGLPTIKLGKTENGVKSEDFFIYNMQKSIDESIQKLAPKDHVNRLSVFLSQLLLVLTKEHNESSVKEKISKNIDSWNLSEDLYFKWKQIDRQQLNADEDQAKLIATFKGLRTDSSAYSDDGYKKIRKVLKTNIHFTDKEKEFLENAPLDETDATEEFFTQLKEFQNKYISQLSQETTVLQGGDNVRLENWMNDAISEAREKEAKAYEDTDTFLTSVLESLRADLLGNSQYIKDSIQMFTQSMAATNQIAGSLEAAGYSFQNVVLEEAARSNPLDILIPMSKATSRIIMVGDQKQLPHLLERDIVDEAVEEKEELKDRYQDSLFGIIFNNLGNATSVRRITLTNQFRMHPVIGDFISNTFYDGEISSQYVKPESKLHGLSIPWVKDKVIVFCDVPKSSGLETKIEQTKVRQAEAEKIVQILNELQADPAFSNLNVGIITFYSKQVEVIEAEASKFGYTQKNHDGTYSIAPQFGLVDGREKLRIGSVDSFQGKEFDVVILSTVRSNTIQRIDANNLKIFGFLTLENRLNVAFSRAQRLLITVGDASMFNDDFAKTHVKGLYEYYKLTGGEYGTRI